MFLAIWWAWMSFTWFASSVPPIAERAGTTTWHPHHIGERYGLFTIILLLLISRPKTAAL
ncbi:low temperature requirement protein A [Actinomadura pelletieri]|uniref:low temperature requirement protein A n=1 Tax=Actinomadura pelletieri TaxID=111805 RepID=UPI00147697F3|nr:low temperature requirement protein A [Actinomadura pelletieri]